MEIVISTVGPLAAVASIVISLLTYTSDARLHRRIARLHAAHTMMVSTPSHVIHRALRRELAKLQAREALRPQLRTHRFGAVAFTALLACITAELMVFVMTRMMALRGEAPVALIVLFVVVAVVLWAASILMVMLDDILVNRRDRLARAFIPGDDDLGEFPSDPRVHVSWRRPLAKACVTTVSVIIGGAGLGLVATASMTDHWPSLLLEGSFLAVTGACVATISALAKVRKEPDPGYSHPTREDFLARGPSLA